MPRRHLPNNARREADAPIGKGRVGNDLENKCQRRLNVAGTGVEVGCRGGRTNFDMRREAEVWTGPQHRIKVERQLHRTCPLALGATQRLENARVGLKNVFPQFVDVVHRVLVVRLEESFTKRWKISGS